MFKVKKIILKSFMYCLKLGFSGLFSPPPPGLFIWRFVGFLFLGCLLEACPFQRLNKVNIEAFTVYPKSSNLETLKAISPLYLSVTKPCSPNSEGA
jgi:hypothetical protein